MENSVLHVQFLEEVELGWTNDRPDGCLVARSDKAIMDFMDKHDWFNPKQKEFSRPVGKIIYCNVKDGAVEKLDSSSEDAVWLTRSESNQLIIDENKSYKPKKKLVISGLTGAYYEVDNK